MARTIRFHLDENGSRAVADGLRRRDVDVTTTPEADLLGAVDQDHIAFCLAQGRVLFTQDRDFLAIHNSGAPLAGIAYCDNGTRTSGQITNALLLSWEVLEPEEMTCRVEYL